MAYEHTVAQLRTALDDVHRELDLWFARPEPVLSLRAPAGGWSVAQILEHISLTNHFLMLTLRRAVPIAVRRAARGGPVPDGESDLLLLDTIGRHGSFPWIRPEHMEPSGQVSLVDVQLRIHHQLQECGAFLDEFREGQGSLYTIRMTVAQLGRLDLYQWLYFLVQHARRHVGQMASIELASRPT